MIKNKARKRQAKTDDDFCLSAAEFYKQLEKPWVSEKLQKQRKEESASKRYLWL